MKEFTIYLAGACKGLHDEGKEWRTKAEITFKTIEENKNVKIKVINPTRYFKRDGSNMKSNRQVKQFYLSKIRKCDLVLINLENTMASCGSAFEIQFAEDHRIPIVGFGSYNVYEWFPECCDVVFTGINEAIDYISDFYLD